MTPKTVDQILGNMIYSLSPVPGHAVHNRAVITEAKLALKELVLGHIPQPYAELIKRIEELFK